MTYLLLKESVPGSGFLPVLDQSTGHPKRFETRWAAMTVAEHEPDFVTAAYIVQEGGDDV